MTVGTIGSNSCNGYAVCYQTNASISDCMNNTVQPATCIPTDTTPPTLNPVVSPSTIYLNGTAIVTSGAADADSGLASQSCDPLVINSVGAKSVTCTATDNVGNSSSATVTYNVIYRFDGFVQPINDPVHPQFCVLSCPISIFEGGGDSIVPVKFRLKDANGKVVRSASLPVWLTPVNMGSTNARINEWERERAATVGNNYQWNGIAYIYKWSTKHVATRTLWRIGVRLDDGQTYYVTIGLR